jgi:hypothetical protein
MIRNRNVAENAGIDPSKLAGAYNYDMPNNVRRVVQTTSGDYYRKIIDTMPTGMVYTNYDAAIAAADEGDVIYIHAGDAVYEPQAVANITDDRLKIVGQLSGAHQWGSPSLHVHQTDTKCLTINAHQVEIAFLGFHHQTANVTIDIGTTQAVWRTHIHDCYFGGNGTATYAIATGLAGAGSQDCPCTLIERCVIQNYVTAGVYNFSGYFGGVRDSVIQVGTSTAAGVIHNNNTTSRPWFYISGNEFAAMDSTNSIGISIVNTPSAGYLTVHDNVFIGFASDAKCISKRTDNHLGRNWNNEVVIASTS